jgi:magnesium-transporting ATPase (P-type)
VAQFTDPLVVLLLVAIVISLVAWWVDGANEAPLEAIVIAIIVALNAAIGFWQESRAIEAVAALKRLSATHARVMRDGEICSVPADVVVPGDVVALAEGDAVCADCRLVDSASLRVIEGSLTGESEPVEKSIEPIDPDVVVADRTNMVFNGTAIARGRGRAIVVATGMQTEIGQIAAMLDRAEPEPTPLERQIAWLGRVLGLIVVVLSAVVVGAIVLTSDIRSTADLLDAALVGVSLAVAAVPEGLPAILTIVLALGVQRMAEEHAVVKKLASVETLGCASVICSDKTGTLTRNEMTVVRVVTPSAMVEVTGTGYEPVGDVLVDGTPLTDESLRREVELVLAAGSLVNDADVRRGPAGGWEVQGDPTEIAFLVAERKLGLTEQRLARFSRVAEIPFSSERKMMTTIDRDAEATGGEPEHMLVTKGAPEVLLDRCTHERVQDRVVVLTDERRTALQATVDELADEALRTLAVAYREIDEVQVPIDESVESGLVHLGVVGIIDPPRPEVVDAIEGAHRAGVRVMMITGDHPRTAARIGERLGLDHGASVTGTELVEMRSDELVNTVSSQTVFARVAPEHKLAIVEALQSSGDVVAMTGDGVNDAPALRRADIGVAMGINGTEVSKEAADMVLADDNFATILRAVREGREIFADIRKFLRYLLGSNAGEVLVMFIGVLAASAIGLTDVTNDGDAVLAVPLLATQILWINLLTDSALALALGVDPAVDDVMAQSPRRPDDRVIDRPMFTTIALVGVTTAIVGLVALDLELAGGLLGGTGDIDTARTMLFTTVVLAQIFNAFNSRSDRVSAFVRPFENRLLWLAVAVTVGLQVLVVHAEPLNRAFDTVPLDARRWVICWALASVVLLVDEIRKLIVRARSRRPS